jgi:hypothetical protein
MATVPALRYTTEDNYPIARDAFLNYYTRQGPFSLQNEAWECAENPKVFWQLHWDSSSVLATLAIRLWNTLANEVPCERAFSTLKSTKSKTRNRLTDEHVDKLLYIQINTRVFTRKANIRKDNSDDSDDEDSDDDISDDEISTAIEETPYSQANTLVGMNGQGMDSQSPTFRAVP